MRRPTSTTRGSRKIEDRAARVAEAAQRRPLGDHLQETAEERPERHRHRTVEPGGHEQRRKGEGRDEEGDVEEAGGEGRHGEPALGVERRHAESGRPHEEDVREDERRHVGGALELLGIPLVAVGEDVGQRTCSEDPAYRHDGEGDEGRPACPGEEPPGRDLPVLREGLGEHRHERARHGPLGQELAKGVGDRERHEERVRLCPPEDAREGHVAPEPQDARHEGPRTDDASATNELRALATGLTPRLRLVARPRVHVCFNAENRWAWSRRAYFAGSRPAWAAMASVTSPSKSLACGGVNQSGTVSGACPSSPGDESSSPRWALAASSRVRPSRRRRAPPQPLQTSPPRAASTNAGAPSGQGRPQTTQRASSSAYPTLASKRSPASACNARGEALSWSRASSSPTSVAHAAGSAWRTGNRCRAQRSTAPADSIASRLRATPARTVSRCDSLSESKSLPRSSSSTSSVWNGSTPRQRAARTSSRSGS